VTVFPFVETGLRVALDLDGDGSFSEDVTAYLIGADEGLSFFRGLPDLGDSSSTSVTLRFNDADERFSTRNPTGPYYGRLGRNTRVQLSIANVGVGEEILFTGSAQDWQPVVGAQEEDREAVVTVRDDLGRNYWARLASAYRRGVTAADTPLTGLAAYWPMEESSGAHEFSSGLPDGRALVITGAPSLAADSDSFECSDPLPTFATGAKVTATLPSSLPAGQVQVRFLLAVPAGGVPAETSLGRITLSGGTIGSVDFRLLPGGSVAVTAYDRDGASLGSGSAAYTLNGRKVRFELSLQQSGSNVLRKTAQLEVGEITGFSATGTVTSQTLGKPRTLTIGAEGGLDGVTIGHVTVQTTITSLYGLSAQLDAYRGETAAARVGRLLIEEGIPRVITAGPGDTAAVCGPQRSQTLLESMRDAEAADGGFLFTPRTSTGFAYRSQESMCAQAPKVTGSWAGLGIVTEPLPAPIDDDSDAANDVTLSLLTGETVRLVQETGPASVLDPPNGIGRYEISGTANVNDTAALRQRTGWELAVGTLDEPRLSTFVIDFGGAPYDLSDGALTEAEALDLQEAVRSLDVGDRIVITDMPSWWGSGTADLLVVGVQPFVAPWQHRRGFVTRPYAPYRSGVWGDPTSSRWSGEGTTLRTALTTTATSVNLLLPDARTLAGWTHADGDYVAVIGGEHMTVTAAGSVTVVGAERRQTLTVTRSVNGVVKTHDVGAAVDVLDDVTGRWAL
jgi:hypothetical protein